MFTQPRRLQPALSCVKCIITFKAYATDGYLRDIIDKQQFSRLATSLVFSIRDYQAVPEL